MISQLLRRFGTRLSQCCTITCRMSSHTSNQGKLSGKVAIVTASTEGIGYSIAKRFAEDGAKVMISSRKESNVQTAVDSLKMYNVEGMVCHVGKKEDRTKLINETVSKFGGVDILVSNAAVNPVFGPMLQTPEAAWDKIFEINVKAAFLLVQEVFPHMEKRGGGSVILVSSIAGFSPFELLGAYSVSKTALLGLAKGLAPELARSNIRINGVAPGIIKTKFSEAMTASEDMTSMILQQIPQKRIGEPDDISGIASFLASDDSKYITGENIVASGGMQSRL